MHTAPTVDRHAKMMRLILAALAAAACGSPIARSGLHDPVGSVQGLISRVLGPQYVSAFQLQVIPADPSGNDVFELDSSGSQVVIRGSAGWVRLAQCCSLGAFAC